MRLWVYILTSHNFPRNPSYSRVCIKRAGHHHILLLWIWCLNGPQNKHLECFLDKDPIIYKESKKGLSKGV